MYPSLASRNTNRYPLRKRDSCWSKDVEWLVVSYFRDEDVWVRIEGFDYRSDSKIFFPGKISFTDCHLIVSIRLIFKFISSQYVLLIYFLVFLGISSKQ
jgi:hypothetical protein